MARVAYARRSTRVNTTTYPDDPSVPVGTTEWNADPESTGVFGFKMEFYPQKMILPHLQTKVELHKQSNPH